MFATRLARACLAGLLILGVVSIWLAPRPPMIDLPQHAGEIALWRDLILHRSPWAAELRVNLLTPYLVGYGLTVPLAMTMPIGAAMKCVLTAAYLAFVGSCIAVRRELDGAEELDGFFAISFFGFTYAWGFYTFLVAAPVGLAFIWLALRYARAPNLRRGAGLAALGSALLFCHGLTFLMAGAVGGLLMLARAGSLRAALARVWPYLILAAACLTYLFAQHEFTRETLVDPLAEFAFGWPRHHLEVLATGPFGLEVSSLRLALCALCIAAPFLIGLRIDPKRREALVIAAAVLAIMILAPSNVMATSLVFERFSLFVLPAYAWLFSNGGGSRPRLALAVPLIGLAVLGGQLWRTAAFAREEADFGRVMAAVEPGQRALGMVFDKASPAAGAPFVYMHHAVWYQAERGGFVEFNFAWFPPEVVRYRTLTPATVNATFGWRPGDYGWRQIGGDRYRYFFVRGEAPGLARFFQGASCAPVLRVRSGAWRVYENRPCPN